jgi:hypothetical protein
MLSLVSDVVNPVAPHERTDSDSLPIQDLTSKILVFEERTSNLEVCVCSGEASLSAASQSSHAEHSAPSLIIQIAPAEEQQSCPVCFSELSTP